MTKKRSVTQARHIAAVIADPSTEQAPRRSARADRHRGITIVFTTDEHARLHLLSRHRDATYSHTLRSLIAEECNRVWPEGLTRGQLDTAENLKDADKSGRKRVARLKEVERLAKIEAKARERKLLIEEELRRMRKKPVQAVAVVKEMPPAEQSPKIAAWYAARKEKEQEAEVIRARHPPRVRNKLPV